MRFTPFRISLLTLTDQQFYVCKYIVYLLQSVGTVHIIQYSQYLLNILFYQAGSVVGGPQSALANRELENELMQYAQDIVNERNNCAYLLKAMNANITKQVRPSFSYFPNSAILHVTFINLTIYVFTVYMRMLGRSDTTFYTRTFSAITVMNSFVKT